VHSIGHQTYIYFLQAQTCGQIKNLNGFNWPIDVGSFYKFKHLDKVNASYLYNVDKKLSQFDNFQHLSKFDASWWIFGRYFFDERFIHNLSFKKWNKDSNNF